MKLPFWKKAWFLVSVPMGLLLILLLILFFRDIEAVDPPGHMRYTYPQIANEDNFYPDFVEAVYAIKQRKDDFKPLLESVADHDQLIADEWLLSRESNPEPSIDKLRLTIHSKQSFLNKDPKSIASLIEGLGETREFFIYEMRLLQAYARKGEWNEVDKQIDLLNQFYQKVIQVNTMIEGLVLVACRSIWIKSLHELLDHHAVPLKSLVLINSALEGSRSWQALHKESFVAELNYVKILSIELNQPISKRWFPSKANHILVFSARKNLFYKDAIPYYDFLIRHVEEPLVALPLSPWLELELIKDDFWQMLTYREALLHKMMLSAGDRTSLKIRALAWKTDLLKLRVASLRYEREYKKLPNRVEDLIPRFMNKTPSDGYLHQKVTYLPEQALFYVCGPDLKDDGGAYVKDRMKKLDYNGDIVQFIHGFPEEKE